MKRSQTATRRALQVFCVGSMAAGSLFLVTESLADGHAFGNGPSCGCETQVAWEPSCGAASSSAHYAGQHGLPKNCECGTKQVGCENTKGLLDYLDAMTNRLGSKKTKHTTVATSCATNGSCEAGLSTEYSFTNSADWGMESRLNPSTSSVSQSPKPSPSMAPVPIPEVPSLSDLKSSSPKSTSSKQPAAGRTSDFPPNDVPVKSPTIPRLPSIPNVPPANFQPATPVQPMPPTNPFLDEAKYQPKRLEFDPMASRNDSRNDSRNESRNESRPTSFAPVVVKKAPSNAFHSERFPEAQNRVASSSLSPSHSRQTQVGSQTSPLRMPHSNPANNDTQVIPASALTPVRR